MVIDSFKPFVGQHCETTATGSLLNQIGMELSEPMLFGIGEGLGFVFFNFKSMPQPFLGGRSRPGEITTNLCRNLNLNLTIKETSSVKKAWKNIEEELVIGNAVGLQLDCYHLDYFTNKIHFAGHFVCMHGYDDQYAYLIDTIQQGTQSKTSLENLALARNEKGAMAAKNKSYTIEKTSNTHSPQQAIKKAILNTANVFLNPPIKNLGYKGILKAGTVLKKWFAYGKNRQEGLQTLAMLMEKAGTGGALFRNLYRDFLKESHLLLEVGALQEGYQNYTDIALLWTQVAQLFQQTAKTDNIKHLNEAVDILSELSILEKQAMEKLQKACTD